MSRWTRTLAFGLLGVAWVPVPARASTPAGDRMARLPLAFEPNRGQGPPARALPLARERLHALPDRNRGLAGPAPQGRGGRPSDERPRGEPARRRCPASASCRAGATTSSGSDPSRWRTGDPELWRRPLRGDLPRDRPALPRQQPAAAGVRLRGGPGADPGLIGLALRREQATTLDRDGNLVLRTASGDVIERAPVAYQDIDGTRRAVAARYERRGRHEFGFRVAAYDRRGRWSSIPCSSTPPTSGAATTTAPGHRARRLRQCLRGRRDLLGELPDRNPLKADLPRTIATPSWRSSPPPGTRSLYSTYSEGSIPGRANVCGIAVDADRAAPTSRGAPARPIPDRQPLQPALAQPPPNRGHGCDAFVAKLSPAGNALVYSTFLGGPCYDSGIGIAVDGAGSAYVVGQTGGPQISRAARPASRP